MKSKLLVVVFVFASFANPAFAARCTDYSNCYQAVVDWCQGSHPRADGDNDGIPCENVCKSLRQVEKIKREIGCNR